MTADVLMCHGEPVGPTGFCDVCGRKRVRPEPPAESAGDGARHAVTSIFDSAPARLGAPRSTIDSQTRGIVDSAPLPAVTVVDPVSRLLTDPHYPEHHQFCGNPACRKPVGRSYAGQPAQLEGFCGSCRLPFSFSPKLQAGDRVGDRYDVVGWLAHGGLGWVYLARDSHLGGMYVAVKGVINSHDAQALQLAVVERDVLIRLDHPNVVRIGNFVRHPDSRSGKPDDYIVMDHVSGLTLREILRTPGELRVEHVVSYGKKILAALEYLHGEGLLYCDMKPDNVIHTGNRIKIIDLGATRAIGDRTSKPVGTSGYQVSRQEIKEHGLTVRSDIHTAGKTLQELLAAVPEEPDDDVSFGTQSFARLLARAVTAYDQRFATVAEMAEQLDGVQREILSLRDGLPRPAPSTRFEGTAELLDSGLGAIPGLDRWTCDDSVVTEFDSGLPTTQEGASRFPVPRIDPADPAAVFLGAVIAPSPSRLLDKLKTFTQDSVEIELCRVRALLEMGEANVGAAALATAKRLLGDAVFHDWRVQWHHGLLSLVRGKTADAWRSFDRVYSILPAEDAPKLALGFCCEHLGPERVAEAGRCYEAVWRRDNTQASAAFGLARLALRGVRRENRRAAVDVLDRVPPVSRHYDAARVAAVRICVAPLGCGLPIAQDVADATRRLPELYLDGGDAGGEFRDRLTTVVREAALGCLRVNGDGALADGGDVLGDPVDERGVRALLDKSYRKLAGRARDRRKHGILVDGANSVRPKSFR